MILLFDKNYMIVNFLKYMIIIGIWHLINKSKIN